MLLPRARLLLPLLFSLILVLPTFSHASQKVLVSVHPLALLVKSAWPVLEVDALVPANQSPHDFSLKPSDMRKVHDANGVIWLGPEFEPFLVKLMGQHNNHIQLNGLLEEEGHTDSQPMAQSNEHHDEHDHHDPHLWLQPEVIPEVLAVIQKKWSLPVPKQFLTKYQAWMGKASKSLKPLRSQGFISYHSAFEPWVKYFELNQLDVVTNNPEKPVGTRHVVQVRNILESGSARCMFVEPQFKGRLLKKLSKGLDVKTINIDPLASLYKIKSANFMAFYDELLNQFELCLKP